MNTVLRSDETKLDIFGHMNSCYVRRKGNEAKKPQNTHPANKISGGSIALWGYFAAFGPGEVVRVKYFKHKDQYLAIYYSARNIFLGRL